MNTPATHPREEEAAAFVFGYMEPAEREAFARDLETDAVLRQVADELSETAAALSFAVPQVIPPAGLKGRVMQAVKSVPQEGRQAQAKKGTPVRGAGGRVIVGWSAAAAFAILSLVLWDRLKTDEKAAADREARLEQATAMLAKTEALMVETSARSDAIKARLDLSEIENKGLQQSVAKVTEAASAMKKELALLAEANKGLQEEKNQIVKNRELDRMQIATLKSTIAEYQQGVAVVVWDSAKQEGLLRLEKMPPVDSNKDYQLWVVDPSKKTPVNAGVVRVDPKGFAKVQFKPNFAIQQADKFALSVEKKVADPGGVLENAGPIVLLSP